MVGRGAFEARGLVLERSFIHRAWHWQGEAGGCWGEGDGFENMTPTKWVGDVIRGGSWDAARAGL